MLRRGDLGDAVRRVQAILQGWGVDLQDPPGHFGVWTEAAIYLVQRGAGVVADGVVGPQTEALLAGPAPADLAGAPVAALLPVPYLSQRDNVHRPLATCNVTSLAMALEFYGVQARTPGKLLDDELYEFLHGGAALAYYAGHSPGLHSRGVAPEEVLDNLVWAAQQHGVGASFAEDRAVPDIEAEVRAGRPVLLSGRFTGTGHIVLLVGLCQSGDFIVHDPFGAWDREYQSRDGAARIYARERTLAVLKPTDRPEKWGLFFSGAGSA